MKTIIPISLFMICLACDDTQTSTSNSLPQDQMNAGQDSMTAGQDSMTAGQDSMTAGQDSMTAGQDSMTAGQDSMTAGQDSMTAGQDSMAAGQDSMTAGQDSMTAGQDSMTAGLLASDLDGVWSRCLNEELRSVKFTYTFAGGNALGGRWDYEEERYGEGQCLGTASIKLSANGVFTIGQEIDTYYEVDFALESISVSPYNSNAASLLTTLCPQSTFVANQATNISDVGCIRLNIESTSACPILYRILSLTPNELHLGQSSALAPQCMTDLRPSTLEATFLAF